MPSLSDLLPALFPQELAPLFLVGLALAGACIGSFLNVCIYRIPLGLSVVTPGSHCHACGRAIPGWWNIPVVSWLLLRGRAKCCGVRIDARYAVVEAAMGIAFPLLFLRFPPLLAAVYALFVSGLLVASLIDIDHFIIPDRLSIGGALVGLGLGALVPTLHGAELAGKPWAGFNHALGGAFLGGFLLWVVVVVGSKALKKEAMGLGDVKLLAGIGAFLGWEAVLFVIVLSSFLGSFFGGAMLLLRKQVWGSRIPYGPFLALAAVVWLFGGGTLWRLLFQWWRQGMAGVL
ncbi:type 4 prepilin peptidase 1 Aspartic peptidase. MEROPS family A24A [Verrucomicrobium sp. GAS474]|uniref:prepilin peptidase n=1 Tax=Verrucomicrobium sp. GAS474 TaxID=1882831 RepID=UPI000879851D|nr:A24 family peptidase [Verrucomicrobium sp. GAS474]SDT92145.1 type 4 prepilin peptidase 1 Aspartic peptidase. MEROPS family A24A [Verrucomicrobium sp. GAS474]